jgi:hypothetical protein
VTKQQAEKKIEIAIDKMIDLSDSDFEKIKYKVSQALDLLRELESDFYSHYR